MITEDRVKHKPNVNKNCKSRIKGKTMINTGFIPRNRENNMKTASSKRCEIKAISTLEIISDSLLKLNDFIRLEFWMMFFMDVPAARLRKLNWIIPNNRYNAKCSIPEPSLFEKTK